MTDFYLLSTVDAKCGCRAVQQTLRIAVELARLVILIDVSERIEVDCF